MHVPPSRTMWQAALFACLFWLGGTHSITGTSSPVEAQLQSAGRSGSFGPTQLPQESSAWTSGRAQMANPRPVVPLPACLTGVVTVDYQCESSALEFAEDRAVRLGLLRRHFGRAPPVFVA